MSILTHEVAYLTDIGISATLAAMAMGFTGGIGAAGKITFGWLTSRFSVRYVVMLCFTLQLIGLFILMQINTIAMVWLFVIFFGFAMGGIPTILPLATEDIFGKANFAVLYAFVNMVVMGASTAGPPLAGFIYDATGSYSTAFSIFAATYLVSIVIVYFAWGPYPRPLKSRKMA
jgi:MFS family permease